MATPTDQTAADHAERAGGRYRTLSAPRIYVMEPASLKAQPGGGVSGTWIASPGIYFSGFYPRCSCGWEVAWCGPPKRDGDLWVYRVRCSTEGCGEDEIRSPFRLVAGGSAASWLARGWRCHFQAEDRLVEEVGNEEAEVVQSEVADEEEV